MTLNRPRPQAVRIKCAEYDKFADKLYIVNVYPFWVGCIAHSRSGSIGHVLDVSYVAVTV